MAQLIRDAVERFIAGGEEDLAAKEAGYRDYEELLEEAEEVVREGDVSWYIAPCRRSDKYLSWLAWEDVELAADRFCTYSNQQQALEYHAGGFLDRRLPLCCWVYPDKQPLVKVLGNTWLRVYRVYLAEELGVPVQGLPGRIRHTPAGDLAAAQNAAEDRAWEWWRREYSDYRELEGLVSAFAQAVRSREGGSQ